MTTERQDPKAASDLLAPLLADHAIARSVLAAMERAAAELETGKVIDLAFWRDVVEFFEEYFDHVHHVREDELLLPLLRRDGFAPPNTAAAQMAREHELMLPHRLHLIDAVHVQSPTRVRAAVRAFVLLHRQHMELEERHVFPMARAVLGASERLELRQGFAALDDQGMRADRERARQLARRIAAAAGLDEAD